MITKCRHCGSFIDTRLADIPIPDVQGRSGKRDDPRAPGDWDNVCDSCGYGKGLKGGPIEPRDIIED